MSFVKDLFSGNLSFSGSKKAPATKTVGSGGTSMVGGFVEDGEESRELQGKQKFVTYSEILSNVSIIAAGVRVYLNLVSRAGWRAEPVDDSEAAKEAAEFVEEVMSDMEITWRRVIRRAAMFPFHGCSIQEWTAKKREDGQYGFKHVLPRPLHTIERWDVAEDGTLEGVIQRHINTGAEAYIPRSKFVYLVDDAISDSPEGLGIFRHLVGPARRLEHYERMESYGISKDLRGIPIARIPYAKIKEAIDANQITQQEADEAIAALKLFTQTATKHPNLSATLDSAVYEGATAGGVSVSGQRQWDIELLTGDASNIEAVGAAIERITHEIARVMGVEHLLLGQSRGTQSLSKDKTASFATMVQGVVDELTEAFEKDFLNPLWELNGLDEELKPKFQTETIQTRDVEEVINAVGSLVDSGVIIDNSDDLVGELFDELGLTRPAEDALPPEPTDMLTPTEVDAEGNPIETEPANEPKPKTPEDKT